MDNDHGPCLNIKVTVAFDPDTMNAFSKCWEVLGTLLNTIINKENKIMSQLDDLNSAIQEEDVDVQGIAAVAIALQTDLAALLKASQGGGSATDLSTQIAAVQSHAASLATALGILQAADATTKAPAPVISSPLTLSAPLAGPAVSYQIAGSGSPTSFSAAGLPAGLSVDPTTGIISGTPTVAGVSNVTISASNANGAGTATLVITAS
jgi:hypothetical protein